MMSTNVLSISSLARRWAAPWIVFAGALFVPDVAVADVKGACLEAHAEAQTLRRAGQLRAASKKLRSCAMTTCPPLVTNDCARWLTAVESAQPTILLRVRNKRGEDTLEARVTADGEVLAERLTGTALEIDPGEHLLKIEVVDAASERRVVVLEGQKNQLVDVDFSPPKAALSSVAPRTSSPSHGPGTAFFVASGVALASLAVFAGFGISGLERESDLRSECAPGCAQRDIDDVSDRYVVADVALVAAGLSAAVALGLLLFTGREQDRHALVRGRALAF